MLVVASNITTRDPKIERILRKVDLKATRNEIQELARRCAAAGAGLSSTFLDVLKRENMRMVRLTRILKNEVIYSAGGLEL